MNLDLKQSILEDLYRYTGKADLKHFLKAIITIPGSGIYFISGGADSSMKKRRGSDFFGEISTQTLKFQVRNSNTILNKDRKGLLYRPFRRNSY
ncbi:hypothetical protein BG32_16315 [Mesotoga sp. HF07.pep.5.2.highcov]|nr:hypothetical protein BG32_16315 [Mesotoga sp. HF07.pep.5.2.highcov]